MRTLTATEISYVSGASFARDAIAFTGWADGLMAGASASLVVQDAIEGAMVGADAGPYGMLAGAVVGAGVGASVQYVYDGLIKHS